MLTLVAIATAGYLLEAAWAEVTAARAHRRLVERIPGLVEESNDRRAREAKAQYRAVAA